MVPGESDRGVKSGRFTAAWGQRAARRIADRWPDRMGSAGVDVDGLAEDLGVRVERTPSMKASGRWHRLRRSKPVEPRLWEEEAEEIDLVQLKTHAPSSAARRFTLAHELGHAVLDRELKGRSADLPVREQERFASSFAAELLLPDKLARSLRAPFREADVIGALELAQSVRIPPKVLLVRASRDNWLQGTDLVWLDIRTLPNKVTGRDRRPRIVDSVRDRSRWYLPSNRSVRGVFGDEEWLARASRALSTAGRVNIDRLEGTPTKFVRQSVPAKAVAFRMQQSGSDFGPEVLARVALHPEDRDG